MCTRNPLTRGQSVLCKGCRQSFRMKRSMICITIHGPIVASSCCCWGLRWPFRTPLYFSSSHMFQLAVRIIIATSCKLLHVHGAIASTVDWNLSKGLRFESMPFPFVNGFQIHGCGSGIHVHSGGGSGDP